MHYVNNLLASTDNIYYTYDVDGTLISMNYNGEEYFYVRNLQQDIIALIDISGNIEVEYQYDAWGNIIYQTNNTLAKINPYRYRGYRYDEETKWYYLNSRYYNSEIGRFINADGLIGSTGDLLGHNMYAYCQNNPVMMVDPSGYSSIEFFDFYDIWDSIDFWNAGKEAWNEVEEAAKENHFRRNENNAKVHMPTDEEEAIDMGWDGDVPANCHQNSAEKFDDNRKYVSLDGHYEIIVDKDGYLVTDPRDIGTYNYYSPRGIKGAGHIIVDVIPWMMWGNSEDDSTNPVDRIKAFFGWE